MTGTMPTYLGMPSFPHAAKEAVADSQLRRNHTHELPLTTTVTISQAQRHWTAGC